MISYNSALAQKIAFVSNRDGNPEVYVMNGDGSGQTRLTYSPEWEYGPVWSPDGSRILYQAVQAGRDGDSEIFVMNAEGSDPVNLTNYPTAYDAGAQWSPDGSRILFASDRYGDKFDLYIMNADGTSGTAPVRLTNVVPAQSAGHGVWSPDGSKIAYGVRTFVPDSSAVYVMEVSTGMVEQLDAGPTPLYGAQWSPDGKQILAQSDGPLYLFEVDSQEAPRLLDAPKKVGDYHPSRPRWSPDGSKIVYTKWWPYSINADGSGITQLVTDPNSFEFVQFEWTRDGRIVAGTAEPEFFEGNGAIYIMNADGSGLTSLTGNDSDNYDFDLFGDFSPDPTPVISEDGVVMANLVPAVHTIAPLSIVSLFGTGFSAGSVYYPTLDEAGRIAAILGDSCVEINGERAPVFAMLPNQANVQAPSDLPLGPVTVSIIRSCGTPQEVRGNVVMVTVEKAAPAFFLYPPYKADGFIAARFNDGFAAVAPAGMIVDQQGISKPARPGEVINLFGTGWGQTTDVLGTGELATHATRLLDDANLTVTFGGLPLDPEDVLYWGITPGAAGVYQLAITVPANTVPGNHQVVLTLYGRSTPIGPVVPVTAP